MGVSEALAIREAVEFCSKKRTQRYSLQCSKRNSSEKWLGIKKQAYPAMTRLLWLQECSMNGLVSIHAVPTMMNPNDIGAKALEL